MIVIWYNLLNDNLTKENNQDCGVIMTVAAKLWQRKLKLLWVDGISGEERLVMTVILSNKDTVEIFLEFAKIEEWK